jgi:hypothetical protein
MRGFGPLDGGGCRVSLEHLPRAPPGESHQVRFLAAADLPCVRHGMPELMRMNGADPGLDPPPFEHLADP